MAYIGSTPASQGFIPGIDYFSGNGSTLAFTLSRNVTSVYQVEVVIDNVIQNPSSAFTVLNNTITFTSAPLTGTNNIWVEYVTFNSSLVQPGAGTVNTVQLGDINSISSSTSLSLKTNVGVERMRIDSAGNVGIGTSSPAKKLELSTYDSTVIRLTNSAEANYKCEIQSLYANESFVLSGGSGYKLIAAEGYNVPNILKFYTSNAERMRIDSAGNVGIGTSSPSKILHVYTANGNGIYVEDGSSAMPSPTIRVRGWRSDTNGSQTFGGGLVLERKGDSATANGTVLGTIYFGGNYNTTPNFGYAASISGISDGAFTSSTNTPTALTFYTGVTPNLDTNTANVSTGTERMRIDSSGNLLVGTTSQFGSGKVCVSYDGTVYNGVSLRTTNAALNSNFVTFYNSATTNCGGISQNGTTTVNYITSSDYRLKENIIPIVGALDKVTNLNPVTYIWKDTDNEVGEGFIAHELQAICPLAVSGEKDAVNEDGSIKAQGIDPSKLVVLLTAAIQELKAIIDTQQTTIVELQSDIKELKGIK